MFLYFLKVTICWLVFYLVYFKFLSKETFFKTNRWYLLGTLLLGAGIPLLEFLPVFQEDNPVVVYFQPISDGSFYVQTAVNEVVTSSLLDWDKLFLGIYLLGVVICSSRFFIGLGKIYALYRESEIIKKENHILVLTNQPHLPFSFFRYMFWSKDLEMNDVDGQKIVMHEVAHVKGWHSLDVILLEIFSIIFWVSPMVYFYKKSLKTVHEYLADAVVLQTTPTKKYGHLLLRQSQSGLQIALANHFFHSQLKQRIVMMTRSKSRKEAIVKYLFALPVILLLLIAFSKKEAMANNENLPTENIEINNLSAIVDVEKSLLGEVDEMPRFPGCEEITDEEKRDQCAQTKLLTFIYSNIKYPAEARKAGIQGRVIAKFTVLEDGTVAKTKIVRDIGGGCGEAALKVIQALPKMIPGQKDGKAVAVEMTIPVKFKLEGDSKKSPKAEKKTSEDTSKDITVIGFLPNQNSSKVVGANNIFKVVEEMPRFQSDDCEKIQEDEKRAKCSQRAMLEHIYKNVKYPKAAKEAGIQGKAVIEFVVQKDGSIADAKILRNPGGGTGEEAQRVVQSMPNFIPGKQKGEAVNVSYVLPISFKLSDPASGASIKGENNSIELNIDIKPLFIVDGVEFDKSTAGELKPDDIATINVLKGEKATEKYGEKGKEGVVEITLKSGKSKSFESSDDKNINALFVIDGKVVDKSVYNNMSPDDIATMNVLKGKKAIEKYGDKGKNGVIEVTLKSGDTKKLNERIHPIEKKTALEEAGLTYVKISPNPTDGNISIEYGSQEKPMTISISDMNGKEIFSEKVAGGRSSLQNVDVSKAAKGMLLISFFQDGKTYTEKVILQ